MIYDVIIIGAGPAGLMAANQLKKGVKFIILEKNNDCAKKLLLTGGGRCNFTNRKPVNEFVSNIIHNQKMLYSIINRFGPEDIIDFFDKKGVKCKEENDNRIFPLLNKAYYIKEALLKNVEKNILLNEDVIEINPLEIGYEIKTKKNIFLAKKLIVSTGGASFSKTGSTSDHIKLATSLNQPVTTLKAAETGVKLIKKDPSLAGTSIENVLVKYGKIKIKGNLLFTHSGLSGTSIMNLSEFIPENQPSTIIVDLLPNFSIEELQKRISNYSQDKELTSFLTEFFSKRFSTYLSGNHKKMNQISKKDKEQIINKLKNYEFTVNGTTGIESAYVTKGGINMKFINTKTMESKINKGLYFIGESLDLHGPIGGYNLTIAFATGYIAGHAINEMI